MNISNGNKRFIGLALSGGGVRAAAFHAGTLKWLAEKKWLDSVTNLSTVSGGSLFIGLVFKESDNRWPASDYYLDHVTDKIKETLCGTSLQGEALKDLFKPCNWKFALSRANVLDQIIEKKWKVKGSIGDLPGTPMWSINATTAETGRRFRFKNAVIGDYELGYSDAPEFRISSAMAISAAFPGGIGPLSLNTKNYKWRKKKSWNSTTEEIVTPKFKKINLYDGGVYDNLGLEPFFDCGCQKIKRHIERELNYLIVSDAGAPYERNRIPIVINPFRLKKVADILSDQIRALRIRAYVNYLQKKNTGMYLQIGSNPLQRINQYSHNIDKKKTQGINFDAMDEG